jgi:hypothetical protein
MSELTFKQRLQNLEEHPIGMRGFIESAAAEHEHIVTQRERLAAIEALERAKEKKYTLGSLEPETVAVDDIDDLIAEYREDK